MYNLPDDVLFKSNDAFYDFAEQVTGKIEVKILRVQCIRNVRCFIQSTNLFDIFNPLRPGLLLKKYRKFLKCSRDIFIHIDTKKMSKNISERDNFENNRKCKVRHQIQCIRI